MLVTYFHITTCYWDSLPVSTPHGFWEKLFSYILENVSSSDRSHQKLWKWVLCCSRILCKSFENLNVKSWDHNLASEAFLRHRPEHIPFPYFLPVLSPYKCIMYPQPYLCLTIIISVLQLQYCCTVHRYSQFTYQWLVWLGNILKTACQ